ncbi:MAG: hypothetical protein LQ350_006419 [Teloschistes chrysophthalmus]|nr:MAG: hypothetical protein LQ350_006419 [Niorma chrysophthalma]
MSLIIDTNPGPYRPGSQVSGSVLLQGKDGLDVESIQIVFTGRCKTKVTEKGANNSRTHHRGRITLFRYQQVLFTGPYTLQPPHQWPFKFQFPERCHTRGGANFKHPSKFFDDNMHQDLPSSFSYGGSAWMGPDIDSFVSYELEVLLVKSSSIRGIIQVTKNLTMRGYRQEPNPNPQLAYFSQQWTVQSMYLLPEYQDRKPTFGEKLKGKLHCGKMPKSHYVLTALVPTVGVMNQPLPLVLGATYDEDRSTTTTPPAVLLRKVVVTAEVRTVVRCAAGSMWSTADVIEQTNDECMIGQKDFSAQAIKMSDRMEVNSLMSLSLRKSILTPLTPTFRTFNIYRSYGIKVVVVTECGKQKRSSTFTKIKFVILPADSAPTTALCAADEAVLEVDPIETEHLSNLPSYEAATKS